MPGLTASVPGIGPDQLVGLRPRTGRRAASARTVLLLHGMGNNGNVWNGFVDRFADVPDVALWSAELPWRDEGIGDWSHDREPEKWITEAVELARAEAGRVDAIVAHSFSAALLLRVLAERRIPEVGGLVFVSPFYRAKPTDFDWSLLDGLVHTFHETMREGIRVVAAGRGKTELHGAMAQRVCEQIGAYGWARFLDTYLSSPWVATDRIDPPSLVLSGDVDSIAPASDGAALARVLPSARFITIADSGHFPMVEQPQAFAEHVLTFLNSLPRPAALAAGLH